jgi:2-methylcitrate dehydratase PrpD
MNTFQENSYLELMIRNILETEFENFDFATVEHAKNRIIDTLGCLIGGAKDAGNPELLNLIRRWGGAPESTVLVYGDKVPVQNAAMMNSIMTRSFDFEPVSPFVDGISAPGHISGTTVITALTVGELENISGKEMLTSLLVGDDIAARVSIVGSGEITFSWRDRVGPINLFGVTAIAGRLMGLNQVQMRNAFGLLLTYLGGSHQTILDATTAFKLSQGTSARDGIISVQLAKAGWTGVKDVLLADFGYYNTFGAGVRDPAILVRDLGKKYFSDSTFKPYPCCRLNHSAIDCTLSLVSSYDIKIDNINEIVIQVASPVLKDVLGKPFIIGEFPHANAIFSLQYTVANALLRKSVKPEHFTEETIGDPQIKFLISMMRMEELSEGHGESARVKIKMKDEQEFSRFTEIARGDPRNPLSKAQIIEKFWNNISFSKSVSRESAKQALDMIENLENLDSIRQLTRLIVA